MLARVLIIAAGVTCGAGLSQFPEFSQQYVQRLGGAVDALEQVVSDFDSSASAEGLTRDEALAEMTGTDFIERRRIDMQRTIARYEGLSADLQALKLASPFERIARPFRFTDPEVVGAAWRTFKPAVPLTFEGAVFAGGGYLFGAGLLSAIARLLRRRRRA